MVMNSVAAASLVDSEIASLSGNTPPQQTIDLPTQAAKRFAALERQIKLHLLEADSRARVPVDSLVCDIIVSNDVTTDDSSSGNTLSYVGTIDYTTTPIFPPYGGAPFAESLETISNTFEGLLVIGGIPPSGGLALGTNIDFTVAFWAAGDMNSPVLIGSTNLPGWHVGLTNGGAGFATFAPIGGVNTTVSFSTNSVHSGWNYYTFIFARSAGIIQCYVNGASAGSASILDNGGTLGNVVIQVEGYGRHILNEVSVWRRFLGPGEISSIYNAGINGQGVVALSAGFLRNPSPAEPFSIVHYTLQDLQLMSNFVASPILSPTLAANTTSNTLQIQVYGVPGWDYTLQISSNLTSWAPFLTNVQESVPVSAGQSRNGNHFYRAASQ